MGWTVPQHTKSEINRAGQVLVDADACPQERRAAVAIVNNWRSAHGFPLNTLQVSLRKRAQRVDPDSLVAQRIKRLPSIEGKLQRFPSMNLARMQDLGGCRAVLCDVDAVNAVVQSFLTAQHKHELIRRDDYIESPKPSGYRGVHLVYAYHSDKNDTWNGLSIEVQIRSQLQHAWATAVETVGLFTNQSLKSSVGEAEWLRFFQIVSSVIAVREGTRTLRETSSDIRTLKEELRGLARQLKVIERLESYAALLKQSQEHMAQAKFVILALDINEQTLTIRGYRRQDEAAAAYGGIEASSGEETDVVLVSVSSIAGLRTAYPNYFLDTTRFVSVLQDALS